MGKALTSLIKINDMKRQVAEQKLADLRYKISQLEEKISTIQSDVIVKENYIYAQYENSTIHVDITNVMHWKSAQLERVKMYGMAIQNLQTQQEVIKQDMCKLVVQKQAFEKALKRERDNLIMTQDNARDEANSAIWLQRATGQF